MIVGFFVEILQIEFEKLILKKFKAYRTVGFIFLHPSLSVVQIIPNENYICVFFVLEEEIC